MLLSYHDDSCRRASVALSEESMSGQGFRWYDPRVATIRYSGWFVVGYLALLILFGTYGNYRVLELRGGIPHLGDTQ